METIGVRELKLQTSEILRKIREEGAAFEVTYRGRVMARLVPVTQASQDTSVEAFLERLEQAAHG